MGGGGGDAGQGYVLMIGSRSYPRLSNRLAIEPQLNRWRRAVAKEVSITYHFLKIPCSSIKVNSDRGWMARTRSEAQGGLADNDLFALQDSIERLDVLDPLIVLYSDEPPVEPVTTEKIRERLEANGAEVEIIIGYRRLTALRRHLAEAKDPDRGIEVQVVVKSELERSNGGYWELALTKIVASSNAFFKGYSPDDKLRLTKNLFEMIKDQKGVCSHTDILNLMGEQSRVHGMQSAGYKASLRRFSIASNPELYAAVMGTDPSDPTGKTVHDKFKIIDRRMAEVVAKQIGNDPEKVGTFLSAVREEVGKLREKQGAPAFRWRGYKAKLYEEWIYNIRLHGSADGKVHQTFKPYTYKVKCSKNHISIPAVSVNISSTDDNDVSKFVEVTYMICQVAEKMKALLRRLRLKSGQSPASVPEPLEVQPILYGREYKEFIRRFNAENFAHPYKIAKAYGLLEDCEWAREYKDRIGTQECEDVRDLELEVFRGIVAEEVARRSDEERLRERNRREQQKAHELDMENRLRFLRTSPESLAKMIEIVNKMKEKLIIAGVLQESDLHFIDEFSWAKMPGIFGESSEDQPEDEEGEDEAADVFDTVEEPSTTGEPSDENAIGVGAPVEPSTAQAEEAEESQE